MYGAYFCFSFLFLSEGSRQGGQGTCYSMDSRYYKEERDRVVLESWYLSHM
jgi:hypothetical protein